MVRAIALLALLDAARYGEYRATFHGFCVDARRKHPPSGFNTSVEVDFCVSLGKIVVERGLVATTSASAMEPIPWVTVTWFEYALLDSCLMANVE